MKYNNYLYAIFQTCPGRCEELKPCVQCVAFGTGPYSKEYCYGNCPHESMQLYDVVDGEYCKAIND